jgi:FkbM family methyltransferase
MLKVSIKKIFNFLGFSIVRNKNYPLQNAINVLSVVNDNGIESAFIRLKRKIISANTIIDLGAASGTWTQKAMKFWPDSIFLMVEPLAERSEILIEMTRKFPNCFYVPHAVGDSNEKVKFIVSPDLDGSGVYGSNSEGEERLVYMRKLDEVVDSSNVKGPYIIKFDTHGFEIPILSGSVKTLASTEAIIMECYGFTLSDTCIRFPEMCIHLEKLGFRLFDLTEIMRRPRDKAFWQCDAVFLKSDNPVFSENTFHEKRVAKD